MKNASIILNVVLLVAVAILYVLHFKGAGEQPASVESPLVKALPVLPGGIVYVNSDSLLDNYQYFKHKKAELEARQEKIKAELNAESSRLKQDAADYQEKAPGMSELQRQQTEEELMSRQQKLMDRKDQLLGQLDEEQGRSSEELYSRLADFLKKMNTEKKYNFVLGYSRGGGILFANDSLDITSQVLDGLNKEYNAGSTTK